MPRNVAFKPRENITCNNNVWKGQRLQTYSCVEASYNSLRRCVYSLLMIMLSFHYGPFTSAYGLHIVRSATHNQIVTSVENVFVIFYALFKNIIIFNTCYNNYYLHIHPKSMSDNIIVHHMLTLIAKP